MTGLLALLAVALVTWAYRVMFTAAVDGDRLPAAVRARMDAVGPAAFAALIATKVVGTPSGSLVPMVAALVAAGFVTRRTGNHVLAIGVAVAVWLAAAAL